MSNDYLNMIKNGTQLFAGTATADLTPAGSVFLAGYPHVRRYSTGVHDSLLSSALYLEAGGERIMLIANDLIYMPRDLANRARARIAERIGIPEGHILISATHTHSGPKMLDPLATSADPEVPRTDPAYVALVEDRIVEAGIRAGSNLVAAEIGLSVADATGVGTNRRDPAGAKDLAVPVLLVRSIAHKPLALVLVCSMHPTVLHEDSTLISGDFPGLARRDLQQQLDCPVLYHTGPAGDQSPRHVVKANTMAEAERLGKALADAAAKVISGIEFTRLAKLECRRTFADLPLRRFPTEADAQAKLDAALARLRSLKESQAPRTKLRTAEVDWFGAEETLSLARAAAAGRVDAAARSCMPAEIQALLINQWSFIAWPGETFVEFSLEVKRRCPGSFPIAYANGDLQGYLVTQQAADEAGYESSNAIFESPRGGQMLVDQTVELLADRCRGTVL